MRTHESAAVYHVNRIYVYIITHLNANIILNFASKIQEMLNIKLCFFVVLNYTEF